MTEKRAKNNVKQVNDILATIRITISLLTIYFIRKTTKKKSFTNVDISFDLIIQQKLSDIKL